jgi:hypothetical protein
MAVLRADQDSPSNDRESRAADGALRAFDQRISRAAKQLERVLDFGAPTDADGHQESLATGRLPATPPAPLTPSAVRS